MLVMRSSRHIENRLGFNKLVNAQHAIASAVLLAIGG